MFFGNDEQGCRIYIDDVHEGAKYFCPACNEPLIPKINGTVVAHHFAHKARKNCDPWYTDKMSEWHMSLQGHFPKQTREIIVWNNDHTIFHIADVLFTYKNRQYVFEFQHSPISRNEFDQRSLFYLRLGYTVIWVFDFFESESKKRILYEEINTQERTMDVIWPGKDRVRFLDDFSFLDYSDNDRLKIYFHVLTGLGKEVESEYSYYDDSWRPWEYVFPKQRERYFIKLADESWWNLYKFKARYYTEEAFYKILSTITLELGNTSANPSQ